MRKPGFFIIYTLLVLVQILLCNFLNLSQYMVLSLLPALVLSLPIRYGNIAAMIVAFITGFAVDFFSTGMMGLTSLALVPVAAARNGIISLVFGEELFSRGEDISVRRQGVPKMLLAFVMASALYFIVFVWADNAGTTSLGFNLLRVLLSSVISALVSVFISSEISAD